MKPSIRLARAHELDVILEVEHLAGQRFLEYGIGPSEEGDDNEIDINFGDEHREGIKNEMLWVALNSEQTIVGFALAQIIDHEGHLREIDVLPDYGRKGIGRALIDVVIQWCLKKGYNTLTLTTFKDIPWNRPYYEKLGFQIIEDHNLTGHLKKMVEKERETSPLERVPMRKRI